MTPFATILNLVHIFSNFRGIVNDFLCLNWRMSLRTIFGFNKMALLAMQPTRHPIYGMKLLVSAFACSVASKIVLFNIAGLFFGS